MRGDGRELRRESNFGVATVYARQCQDSQAWGPEFPSVPNEPIKRNETSYFSRMSKLIYITNTSLDGYIEDETGAFDWVNPDQVFEFITELLRPVGTHL
jgi:hypothetical protein